MVPKEPTDAADGEPPPHDRRWPASAAVGVVVVLQIGAARQVAPPWWPIAVALEVALQLPLVIMNPVRLNRDHPLARETAAALTTLLLVGNAAWVAQLILTLTRDQQPPAGRLMTAAGLIWVTNVVVSGIAYWELDRGGPFARDPRHHSHHESPPDLLFPQMQGAPGWPARTWRPTFLDYLFVAFTAATAFSPTDTLPLSGRIKVLMMFNAAVSLTTIAVIAARAVNTL